MKNKIVTWSLLLAGMGFLTACPQPKSHTDDAPAAPVLQGRVSSQDANSVCDLNNGTLICHGLDRVTGQRCSTLAKSYNPADRMQLCGQLFQLQYETSGNNFGSTCGVEGALSSAIAQSCQGIANPNPQGAGNGQNPINGDMGFKSYQCDFEAERQVNRWYARTLRVPKTTALIMFTSGQTQRVNLRQYFLDIGNFGSFTMNYTPARAGQPETIELRDEGLRVSREDTRIVQSGSAGSEVKMEALAPGLYMKIACRPSNLSNVGVAPGNAGVTNPSAAGSSAPLAGTQLVCTGDTRTIGNGTEQIDEVIPLNSIASGQVIPLTRALSARLEGSTLSYEAILDRDFGPTVTTESSLRAEAKLQMSNRQARINVNCSVR